MACGRSLYTILLLVLAALPSIQSIKVSFGTNEGPIVPRQPKSVDQQERTVVSRSPAPVSEERADLPNPNTYKPPYPHQYREKLYAFKGPANLLFGTPLDQKYTPSISKYHYYKKQLQKLNLGAAYTGPNLFEKQEYELYPKTILTSSFKYPKHTYGPLPEKFNKYVPEIGVVYSSGVRFYIPQLVVVDPVREQDPEEQNSVYGVEDDKYYQ